MAQRRHRALAVAASAGAGLSADLRHCIDLCLECHAVCLSMASQHCLEEGGEHVEPEHFRLMLACAELCRSAAALMMIGTELHRALCGACAEVCEACAKSCQGLDGMERCAEACRRCAEWCRRMAGGGTA